MAKLDEIKEYIGFLKTIFITLIVIDTSLIAWIFKNYDLVVVWKQYTVFVLIIILCIIVYSLFLEILKRIKSLKDIES
jgi:hypothetical protein